MADETKKTLFRTMLKDVNTIIVSFLFEWVWSPILSIPTGHF